MRGEDALEVAVGRLAHDAVGPHLPDDARDVATEIERHFEATVRVAEERQVGDADLVRRSRLLSPSDAGDLGARDRRIEAAGVAVGDDAVRHLDAGLGPHRDRPGTPEVDVVGVRHHAQDPLDLGIVEHRVTIPSRAHRASLRVCRQHVDG